MLDACLFSESICIRSSNLHAYWCSAPSSRNQLLMSAVEALFKFPPFFNMAAKNVSLQCQVIRLAILTSFHFITWVTSDPYGSKTLCRMHQLHASCHVQGHTSWLPDMHANLADVLLCCTHLLISNSHTTAT